MMKLKTITFLSQFLDLFQKLETVVALNGIDNLNMVWINIAKDTKETDDAL